MSLAGVIIRIVSPEPPHHPEPHPDEPFAPVYDHRPLGPDDYPARRGRIAGGPDLDPVVFGPPDGGRHGLDPAGLAGAFGWCARCDVHWRGDGGCWICGRAGGS